MHAWIWWVIVAGVFGLAEVVTTTLVFAMLSGGALAAAVIGAAGLNVVVQIVGFVVVALALLGLVRPVARRHLMSGPSIRTGAAALVGQQALVLAEVNGHNGRVKIGGEVWSARSYDGESVHDVGQTVDVVQIDGATALVM
jgi:membrane protein implicated in regulation of membrane protease activity